MTQINLIIVGAKAEGTRDLINNPLQASHYDLCELKKELFINVYCYDMGYNKSAIIDNVHYINEPFYLDDACHFQKHSLNIIIEYCNLMDENHINHNRKYEDFLEYTNFKVAFLACGCGWQKGLPKNCIFVLLREHLYTQWDIFNVDSFLTTISTTKYILQNRMQHILQPFMLGTYQIMGTFSWRGCQADCYESENVLRELFTLIIDDIDLNNNDKKELKQFLEKVIHWNHLPWSLRNSLSRLVYGPIN